MENKTQNGCSWHYANWAQVITGHRIAGHSARSGYPSRGNAIGRTLERLAAKFPKSKGAKAQKAKVKHRCPTAPPTKMHPDRKKKISRLGCRSGYGSAPLCAVPRTGKQKVGNFKFFFNTKTELLVNRINTTIQAFDSIFECARCPNHPFDDFYTTKNTSLAAFNCCLPV